MHTCDEATGVVTAITTMHASPPPQAQQRHYDVHCSSHHQRIRDNNNNNTSSSGSVDDDDAPLTASEKEQMRVLQSRASRGDALDDDEAMLLATLKQRCHARLLAAAAAAAAAPASSDVLRSTFATRCTAAVDDARSNDGHGMLRRTSNNGSNKTGGSCLLHGGGAVDAGEVVVVASLPRDDSSRSDDDDDDDDDDEEAVARARHDAKAVTLRDGSAATTAVDVDTDKDAVSHATSTTTPPQQEQQQQQHTAPCSSNTTTTTAEGTVTDSLNKASKAVYFWTSLVATAVPGYLGKKTGLTAQFMHWNYIVPHLLLGAIPVVTQLGRSGNHLDQLRRQLDERHETLGLVVACLEDDELNGFGVSVIQFAKEVDWRRHVNRHVVYVRVPMEDTRATTQFDAVAHAVDALHACIARRHTAYVHCKAGKGRSWMVTMCYLTTYGGLPYDVAAPLVQERRGQINPSVAQQCFAREFALRFARWQPLLPAASSSLSSSAAAAATTATTATAMTHDCDTGAVDATSNTTAAATATTTGQPSAASQSPPPLPMMTPTTTSTADTASERVSCESTH